MSDFLDMRIEQLINRLLSVLYQYSGSLLRLPLQFLDLPVFLVQFLPGYGLIDCKFDKGMLCPAQFCQVDELVLGIIDKYPSDVCRFIAKDDGLAAELQKSLSSAPPLLQ